MIIDCLHEDKSPFLMYFCIAKSQATLVNVSIFCTTHHRLLLPWKILPIGSPSRSVEQFFHDVAAPLAERYSKSNMKLDKVFLGRSKDHLDDLDFPIPLDVAVGTFGAYVRYITLQQSEKVEEHTRVNAFQMMMSSQRQLSPKATTTEIGVQF